MNECFCGIDYPLSLQAISQDIAVLFVMTQSLGSVFPIPHTNDLWCLKYILYISRVCFAGMNRYCGNNEDTTD